MSAGPASTPALAPEGRPSWWSWLNQAGPLLGLVLVYGFFLAVLAFKGQVPWHFVSVDNIENHLRQTAVVGTAALGMTLIIVMGGIDLSVGSVVAIAGVVTALFLRDGPTVVLNRPLSLTLIAVAAVFALVAHVWVAVLAFRAARTRGWLCLLVPFFGVHHLATACPREARVNVLRGAVIPAAAMLALGVLITLLLAVGADSSLAGLKQSHWGLWAAIAAVGGVVAGALCGLANGSAIVGLRLMPFIVTLGMMGAVRGTAKGIADNKSVEVPASWVNALLAKLWTTGDTWLSVPGKVIGHADRHLALPPGVWIMLAMAVAVWIVLRYARLGRHVVAIGSNEQTARLCGVGVGRVKLLIYTLMGAIAGVSGVLSFSNLTKGDPTGNMGLELDVIAAVVIGGGSLSGGEGSVVGSLIGALIMTVIRSGCSFVDWPNWVQEIVTGAIIVVAVALDRWRHHRAT